MLGLYGGRGGGGYKGVYYNVESRNSLFFFFVSGVAVKVFKLSYCNKEPLLFAIT